nr:NAD-glutamate dehydrogenase domain-containing protein [Nocardioides convexus]
MTDEVAESVLRDNYEQNLALANAAKNAPSLLHVHEQWMAHLESEGLLDREPGGAAADARGEAPDRGGWGAQPARVWRC